MPVFQSDEMTSNGDVFWTKRAQETKEAGVSERVENTHHLVQACVWNTPPAPTMPVSGVDNLSALGALSSDYSLSPSPPPQLHNKHTKASSNAARSAGLDSLSELSEVTKDKQEGVIRSTVLIASSSIAKKRYRSIVSTLI